MRTIGLIGGMSWESSAEYYRIINQGVRDRWGRFVRRPCYLQRRLWACRAGPTCRPLGRCRGILVDAARRLHAGGAEGVVLCTNTMHVVAGKIQAASHSVPAHRRSRWQAAVEAGALKVGLLGTSFTMEQHFLKIA